MRSKLDWQRCNIDLDYGDVNDNNFDVADNDADDADDNVDEDEVDGALMSPQDKEQAVVTPAV